MQLAPPATTLFRYTSLHDRQTALAAEGISGFAQRYLGFTPDAAQSELLDSPSKRVLVNCTRQWGKSTITAARIAFEAYMHPHAEIVVMSITEKHAWNLVNKADEFLRRLGALTRGVPCYRVGRQLRNGSKILGTVAREDRARSFSPTLLVIDEAGHVPDSAYNGILPSLAATQGALIILGTPWKQRGFFYEEWHSAENWHRVSVKATECPRIPAEFIEEMRRRRGEEFVRREFMCEFVGSDDRLFSRQDLSRMVAIDLESFRNDDFGPRAPNREIIFALDLGKLRDFTALSAVERIQQPAGLDPVTKTWQYRRRNVLRLLEKAPLGTAYPKVVDRVREVILSASTGARLTLIVDSTGVGEPVVDDLRRLGLNCRLIPVSITSGSAANREGDRYLVPRRDLLVGLQGMIHRHDLELAADLPLRDDLTEELLSMGRTLRSEPGAHDDLLFSVALAAWHLRTRRTAGEKGDPLCF